MRKGIQMETPIYDGMEKVRQEALKAGYKAGRAEMQKDVVAFLKSLPKPTKALRTAILEVEAMP
jgi:cytochrome c1